MIPTKILAIILLVYSVVKFGHPFRVAFVFAAITAGLAAVGGGALEDIAIRTAVSLVVGAFVFWLIDRTQSMLLSMIVMVAGIGALLVFG